MALGSAIAQGLVKGLGLGLQAEVTERKQEKKIATAEKMRKEALAEERAYQKTLVAEQRTWQEQQTLAQQELMKTQAKFQLEGQKEVAQIQFKNRLVADAASVANNLKSYKKQQLFSIQSEQFKQQGINQANWEQLAGMSVRELAVKRATAYAAQFPKDERASAFQFSMEQTSGMTKAALINDLGGTQADYTDFIDNPDFKDAIPKPKSYAGIDMEEIFTFDPAEYEAHLNTELQSMTEGDKKRQETDLAIKSTLKGPLAIPNVSQDALRMLREARGTQDKLATGADANRVDLDLLNAQNYIDSGVLVKHPEFGLVTKSELDDYQVALSLRQQEEGVGVGTVLAPGAQPTQQFERTPLEITGGITGEDIGRKKFLQEEKRAKQEAKTSKAIDSLNKDDNLSSVELVSDITDELSKLGDDVFGIGISGFGSPEVVRNSIAAGRGFGIVGSEETAQSAKDFSSKLATFRNQLRNSLFGATLTSGEKEAFDQMIEELGASTTREGMTAQLNNLRELIDGKMTAKLGALDEDTLEDAARRNPTVRRLFIDMRMREFNIPADRRAEVEAYVNNELGLTQ